MSKDFEELPEHVGRYVDDLYGVNDELDDHKGRDQRYLPGWWLVPATGFAVIGWIGLILWDWRWALWGFLAIVLVGVIVALLEK